MESSLRAGAAVFNAGYHHAAHDAWEQRWLELEAGPDERLFHGLIQYTAAVHHGDTQNWAGLQGLAASAHTNLADLDPDYRGVDVDPVRTYLAALAADPETIERRSPPAITVDGTPPTLAALDAAAAFVAAPVLAEALDYDETVLEQAVTYAETDLDRGEEGSAFISLVLAFVGDDDRRPTVYDRVRAHVERRETRERDVEDLF
ncbi:MAG: DUF309 domain-containing protein [Halobacteriaceae archaeon]